MKKLEIACFNLESAIIAQTGGADRVELCDNIQEGGTTPDFETTKLARMALSIDLFVMIRPRGGGFVYSDEEFQQMKQQMIQFKEMGINGFVFGILKEDGSVNKEQNAELVQLAQPYPCTFHRAFDEVKNPFEALEQIIGCGFTTILTSGQQPNVVEGMNRLAQLVNASNNRIVIMPGGGLRSSNIGTIKENTKAVFYHSSAITDGSEIANADEIQALNAKLK